MVKRFPTVPSHAQVKCLSYDDIVLVKRVNRSVVGGDVAKEVPPLALLSCLRHLRQVQVTTSLIRACQAK